MKKLGMDKERIKKLLPAERSAQDNSHREHAETYRGRY
jgi:hypothetical protein